MKKLLYFLSLFSISLIASQDEVTRLHSRSIQTHPGLGTVCLSHKNGNFTVAHNGKVSKVAREDSDPLIRAMDSEQLRRFLRVGKIRVNQYNNGDYKLSAHGSLAGGGPGTGLALYGLVKTTGYVLPFAWMTVKLTEGDANGAEQIGKAATKEAGKFIAARVVTDTAARTAANSGGTIAYTITKKVGTDVTREAIGAAATTTGGYFTVVEAAANAAYWVGMAIPFLP